jgi:hypothetical protein
MEKWKNIIKNLLLAFVLISIGFAIGKNTVMRSAGKPGSSVGNAKSGQYLKVYYTHAAIRCETCNNIEKMTHELLESKFKKELANGRIEWQVVNFQENEAFAEEFDVVANGVIAVLMEGDKIVDYERFDEVWTLHSNPPAFNSYLEKAILKLLTTSAGGLK